MLTQRIVETDKGYQLSLKCGTQINLSDLEAKGISYIPIGDHGNPIIKYAYLLDEPEQITQERIGFPDAFWQRQVYGIQIILGQPSQCHHNKTTHYLVDIDIEAEMIKQFPDAFKEISSYYSMHANNADCMIDTKSKGVRLCAWTPYLEKVVKFTNDKGNMLIEIHSRKGMGRYDERYAMSKGSLLNIPFLELEVIERFIGICQSTKGISRLSQAVKTGKRRILPDVEAEDSGWQPPANIEWEYSGPDKQGNPIHKSIKRYPCEFIQHTNDDTEPAFQYFLNHNKSIGYHCFKCGEGGTLRKSPKLKPLPTPRKAEVKKMDEHNTDDVDMSEVFDEDEIYDEDEMYGHEQDQPKNPPNHPVIHLNYQSDTQNPRPDPTLVDEALECLVAANKEAPQIFHRGGVLCRIKSDEDGRVIIDPLTPDGVSSRLSRVASWQKWMMEGKRNNRFAVSKNASVPKRITLEMIAFEDFSNFHPLIGLANHPILRNNGEWSCEPGYDAETGYYISEKSVQGIDFTEKIELDEAKRIFFDELLYDFPFEDDSSRVHALAFALSPLIRPMVGLSPTPLFLFDAAAERTGKGLLAKTLHYTVTGMDINIETVADKPEEWDKRIIASLMAGNEVIFYDNVKTSVRKPLDSDKLAAAITATQYSSRLLGFSHMVSLPVRNTWAISGNNMQLSGEIVDRSVPIRLVRDTEDAESRDPALFKHQLPDWAIENRGIVLPALMTFITEWVDAGMPLPNARFAGFEKWASIVMGIFEVCQIDNLFENRKGYKARVNVEREALRDFAEAVVEHFGEGRWKPKDVFEIASFADDMPASDDEDALTNLLGELIFSRNDQGRKQQIGHILKKNVGRVFGGYRLDQQRQSKHQYYRFTLVEKQYQAETQEDVTDTKHSDNIVDDIPL